MKKIFSLFFVAVSLAACNSSSNSKEEVKDSVLNKIDSTGDARIDSVKQATDSMQKKAEVNFNKTDSANKAIGDSTGKKKK